MLQQDIAKHILCLKYTVVMMVCVHVKDALILQDKIRSRITTDKFPGYSIIMIPQSRLILLYKFNNVE